ncbi:hypothetical protein H8959_014529 [Pygathrix nigripes]
MSTLEGSGEPRLEPGMPLSPGTPGKLFPKELILPHPLPSAWLQSLTNILAPSLASRIKSRPLSRYSALNLQDQVLVFPYPHASLCQHCLWAEVLLHLQSLKALHPLPWALSVIQEDTLPSAEMALILHRKGFDCGLEAKNLGFNCTTSQGKVSRVGKPTPGNGRRELGKTGLRFGDRLGEESVTPGLSGEKGGSCGHVFRAPEAE